MVHGLVKERLTGAVLLVALIVLLVPELLQGPIRPAPQARGPESAAEEAPLKSVTISLADDTRTGAPPPQPPSPAAPAAEPAGAAAQPPPATASGAAPMAAPPAPPTAAPEPVAAAPPASPPVPKSTTAGGFVVQLGSFANRANADRLAQQVRARGFPVLVSRSNKGKHLYRVQVGPARDHAGAEQLLTRLRATGHGGPIIPQ
ncbi:MAG TPA: SPOR domain-containing protein [Steroidobacteraceae bacterium]|jgi:DedD protein|nr:SPOR domain-containing protein [Steroidobacteraceae bacterium]